MKNEKFTLNLKKKPLTCISQIFEALVAVGVEVLAVAAVREGLNTVQLASVHLVFTSVAVCLGEFQLSK